MATRIALALGAGAFVGLERERRGKSGARTFALVCAMAGASGALGDGYSWAVLGVVGSARAHSGRASCRRLPAVWSSRMPQCWRGMR